MNKQANDNLHLLLASLLTGGGAYAAGRGIKDTLGLLKEDGQDPNELKVNLPDNRRPKIAGFEGAMNDYVIPAGIAGGGLLAGFHGASSLYEALRKKQIKRELADEEKEYLTNLTQVRGKVASMSTPNVDSFFEGFFAKCGEELEKCGFLEIFKTPGLAGKEGIGDVLAGQGKNILDSASDSEVGKMILAGMIATGLGTAGMTYSTAKKIDGRKDKDETGGGFPNEVRLSFGG